MKILQILLVYFLALLVGLVILLLLSIPFPHLPGWAGLVVGVVVGVDFAEIEKESNE